MMNYETRDHIISAKISGLLLASALMGIGLFVLTSAAKGDTLLPDERAAALYPYSDALGRKSRSKHSREFASRIVDANGNDPRPARWCGWWMRQELGVANKAGNLARWWAGYGSNAHGPAVGAIVVWRHHVGIITGRGESGWIVKSGNDGRAVRERERSLRGAIAFRWPNRMAGL